MRVFFGLGTRLKTAALAVLLMSLAACSTVTTKEAMVVEAIEPARAQLAGSTAVVVGGEPRMIDMDNFTAALTDSLVASKLFGSVDNEGDAPFMLNVEITHVDMPMFGAGFEIGVESVWKLFRNEDRALVFEQTVKSNYEGGAFEGGFFGANRVRVATEASARENIRLGIEALKGLESPE